MPLFQRQGHSLELVKAKRFGNEKELQNLIENNLQEMFNCSFVATEFSTGPKHGGRIDTLALSEENNPVIIEYKVVESSQLINQSLYYLSWVDDHRGDFEIAVKNANLTIDPEVDWSDIRVICIAPEYKKYDIHAVQMMGANIELWQYRYYENDVLYFEEVFKKSTPILSTVAGETTKDPIMVAAGKKAAITRAKGVYSFDEHLKKVGPGKRSLVIQMQEYILGLDESVEEVPKKFYVAYKVAQNFVCMEVQKSKILLYLKIHPNHFLEMPAKARDVTKIGHFGTGNFELTVTSEDDMESAKELILLSFSNIGGN